MKMVDLFMESGFSFHDSAEVLNTILTDQPEVDYVLSGMSNEERLLDNIRRCAISIRCPMTNAL